MGMGRWQAKLEHQQVFLGRIVDIGAELFAISAACIRAEQLRSEDPAQGRSAYELADAFCLQSRERIRQLFTDLWRNSDGPDRKLSNRILEGNYTWLEDGILDPSEGTGPWITEPVSGPSNAENLHRNYR